MRNLILCAVALAMTPALALAQSPPTPNSPVAPKAVQVEPNGCAHPGTRATVGQGGDIDISRRDSRPLSDKLAASNGVICPPGQVDPEIRQPTPPGGAMQVIPPPGSPGGDPSVTPK
ncbi:MAG TPA: hypothetical protein VGC36_11175 [Rhizomicrobium sp.]